MPSMPVRKTVPHKTLARNLFASNKLTKAEQTAFGKMVAGLDRGDDLSDHQKLWVETLKDKYLTKK